MLRRILDSAIEFSCDLDPDLPLIRADRAMLDEVVLNFAVNSGDAMANGGRLTISTLVKTVTPNQLPRVPVPHVPKDTLA